MPSEHILEQTQTSAITSTAEIWMSFHYCHPIFETEVFLAKTTWSMQDVTHTQWVLDVKEKKLEHVSPRNIEEAQSDENKNFYSRHLLNRLSSKISSF